MLPAIVGGAIMGVGFILGGLLPARVCTGAAIGKVDGMFFIGRGLYRNFCRSANYFRCHWVLDSTFLRPNQKFNFTGNVTGTFYVFY